VACAAVRVARDRRERRFWSGVRGRRGGRRRQPRISTALEGKLTEPSRENVHMALAFVSVAFTCPCATRAGKTFSAAIVVIAFVVITVSIVVEGRRRTRRGR